MPHPHKMTVWKRERVTNKLLIIPSNNLTMQILLVLLAWVQLRVHWQSYPQLISGRKCRGRTHVLHSAESVHLSFYSRRHTHLASNWQQDLLLDKKIGCAVLVLPHQYVDCHCCLTPYFNFGDRLRLQRGRKRMHC